MIEYKDSIFPFCKHNEHNKCPQIIDTIKDVSALRCVCDCGHSKTNVKTKDKIIAESKVRQEIREKNEVSQEENKNKQLNEIHNEWLETREKARMLDNEPIVNKLAETFCPSKDRKTINEMTPDEVCGFRMNLQEMINIIKVYIMTTEQEINERKKTNRKEMEEADKKYKVSSNEPTVVSSKLNTVEKALWSFAKNATDDDSECKELYYELKKIWRDKGMAGVQEYIDANID